MEALKRILYRSLLYTAPVWILYLYIEFRLSHVENSYSYKIKHFEEVQPGCEILVMGNSQMLKGINPGFLPGKSFNMANVSQTLPWDLAIVKHYLPKLPQLKTVIIGLCYTSFGEDLQTSDEAWRLSFYKKYYDIDPLYKFDIKVYSNTLRYMPYEALKMTLKNFKVDLVKGFQPNGWMKVEGTDSSKFTEQWAAQRVYLHTGSLNESNIPKNIAALWGMIEILHEKGIRVILVVPAVDERYIKKLDPHWVAKNDSIISQVKNRYGLPVLDFTKSNPADFTGGFNDVDHLNAVGAEKMTRMIANAPGVFKN